MVYALTTYGPGFTDGYMDGYDGYITYLSYGNPERVVTLPFQLYGSYATAATEYALWEDGYTRFNWQQAPAKCVQFGVTAGEVSAGILPLVNVMINNLETYLSFDGNNDTVIITHDAALNFEYTDDFSIGMWIRTTNSSNIGLFFKHDGGGIGYSTQLFGSGEICFMLKNTVATSEIWINSTNTVNDGKWHYVVCTWNGSVTPAASDAVIYIDGVAEVPFVGADTLDATIQNIANAAFPSQWAVDSGEDITHVTVWNTTLSSAQVLNMYCLGRADVAALYSPIADWRITRDDIYPTITDYGSGGNDGTMTNMAANDIVYTQKTVSTDNSNNGLYIDAVAGTVTWSGSGINPAESNIEFGEEIEIKITPESNSPDDKHLTLFTVWVLE